MDLILRRIKQTRIRNIWWKLIKIIFVALARKVFPWILYFEDLSLFIYSPTMISYIQASMFDIFPVRASVLMLIIVDLPYLIWSCFEVLQILPFLFAKFIQFSLYFSFRFLLSHFLFSSRFNVPQISPYSPSRFINWYNWLVNGHYPRL